MADVSIHAIIIMTTTVIGSFFLFRHLMRKKKAQESQKKMDIIKNHGVEFTASEPGLGFDPKKVRKDGRMPCCLTFDWTNPETGQSVQIKSQWFWYNPRDKEKRIEFRNVKGFVLADDPTATVDSPPVWLTSKHSIRDGVSARLRASPRAASCSAMPALLAICSSRP